MRCFLGIPLSDDAATGMARLQERLGVPGAGVRLVERGNMHITVRFYGDAGEKRVEEVSRRMDGLGQGRFNVLFDRIDAFPNRGRAHVLWAGIGEGAEEIRKIGEAFGEKDLIPHVTLARFKSRPPGAAVGMMGEPLSIRMEAERLQLMKSELTKSGAVYGVLHERNFD